MNGVFIRAAVIAILLGLTACTQVAVKDARTRQAANSIEVAAPRYSTDLQSVTRGTWIGSLSMRQPVTPTLKGAPPDTNNIELKLEIEADSCHVYLKQDGHWLEAMPGRMKVDTYRTNAVVFGFASGPEEGENWIETWSMVLSVVDNRTALVEWSRAVTNLDPGEKGFPGFSMAATGILTRGGD
jgi:hypothetical protein